MKVLAILSCALMLTLGCMPPSGGGSRDSDSAGRDGNNGRTGGVRPLIGGGGGGNSSQPMGNMNPSLARLCDRACDRLAECDFLDDSEDCANECRADDDAELIANCVVNTSCADMIETCFELIEPSSSSADEG